MITKENFKKLLEKLEFIDNNGIYSKNITEFHTELKADFQNEKLIYPKELKVNDKTTSNFSSAENFVVFECVHRLLSQGYNPKHIELEPKWQVGHGASGGKADILIKDNDDKTLLIIECKTAGSEFKKAWDTTQTKPTQLFSYAQQDRDTKFIALYASDFVDEKIKSDYYLISLSDDEKRLFENKSLKSYKNANTVENIYEVWSETYKKEFKKSGIFESNKAYYIGLEKTNINDLKIVSSEDIKGKYNEFATIMRQHNIGGAERAFNILVNLFLCKIIDENENIKNPQSGLKFYWKGIAYDDAFLLQDRLQELYKIGMFDFLNEEITYISEATIDTMFNTLDLHHLKANIKTKFREQKFFTNNDFSFLDVHSKELFYKNFEVLLKVVEMFQDIRLTGVEDNQFLGDMFEGFLDNGVKQSEGQFFTPMPIVKFIINSLPLESIKKTHKNPQAIDFACGAGHFLNEVAKVFTTNEVVGIEKEYRLSKVAKVSALMYGQENIDIIYNDALTQDEKIKNSSFSVLVANPPYSVKGFLETLNKDDINAYELTKTIEEKSYSANNAIECFFIEKAKQILATNGVTGIILPSSILSKGDGQNSYVATREIIIKYFEIIAIAEFGSGTFGKTGTNTVTLFLKRRDDLEDIVGNYKDFVDNLFIRNINIKELFKDKYLLENYCTHIEIGFKLYMSLFKDTLNQEIFKHETFAEYKTEFEKSTATKNRKKQKNYKELSQEEKDKKEALELLKYIKNIEADKLYYFCLATQTKKEIIIIKAPSDGKENKKFLGYEWSGRKGNEGIQYNGGTLSKINTPLYNPSNINDTTKINTLISKNFIDDNVEIPQELERYVSKARLVDMLDFSRKDFNKAIGLNPKRKIKILGKEEWQVRLGEIAEVKKGKVITLEETIKGNIKVVAGGLNFAYYHNKSNRPKDTITISASGANAGFVNIWKEEIYASDCTTIIGNDKTIQLYLYNVLKLIQQNIFYLARGSAQPHVYPSDIQNLKIPLPPLDIQEKIVKECQEIDDEVLKANEIIKTTKELIEKEINSVKGEIVKLGDKFKTSSGGTPLSSKNEYYINGNIPWVNSGEVKSGLIIDTRVKITKLGLNNSSAKLFPINTVLVAMYGATTGEVGILGIEASTNQAVCGILPNKQYAIPIYLYFYLREQIDEFKALSKGVARSNISQEVIKNFTIKLPPLETQKQIVYKIEKLETQITKAKKTIDEASEKKEEILKRYLEE